jgi:hypothetical protein
LKINTFDKVAKSSLDKWIYYFKNAELPQACEAKGLKEVEKRPNGLNGGFLLENRIVIPLVCSAGKHPLS